MRITLTLEKWHKRLKYIEKGCHFRHGSQDIAYDAGIRGRRMKKSRTFARAGFAVFDVKISSTYGRANSCRHLEWSRSVRRSNPRTT